VGQSIPRPPTGQLAGFETVAPDKRGSGEAALRSRRWWIGQPATAGPSAATTYQQASARFWRTLRIERRTKTSSRGFRGRGDPAQVVAVLDDIGGRRGAFEAFAQCDKTRCVRAMMW